MTGKKSKPKKRRGTVSKKVARKVPAPVKKKKPVPFRFKKPAPVPKKKPVPVRSKRRLPRAALTPAQKKKAEYRRSIRNSRRRQNGEYYAMALSYMRDTLKHQEYTGIPDQHKFSSALKRKLTADWETHASYAMRPFQRFEMQIEPPPKKETKKQRAAREARNNFAFEELEALQRFAGQEVNSQIQAVLFPQLVTGTNVTVRFARDAKGVLQVLAKESHKGFGSFNERILELNKAAMTGEKAREYLDRLFQDTLNRYGLHESQAEFYVMAGAHQMMQQGGQWQRARDTILDWMNRYKNHGNWLHSVRMVVPDSGSSPQKVKQENAKNKDTIKKERVKRYKANEVRAAAKKELKRANNARAKAKQRQLERYG